MSNFKIEKSIKIVPGDYFSKNLSNNFDDHIKKSIPFYNDFLNKISNLSNFFVRNNSYFYDLGCSTGNLISRIVKKNQNKKNVKFIGIDNSKSMIKICKKNLTQFKNTKIYYGDILKYKYKNADLITSSLTTHFIKPNLRQKLFQNIFNNLNDKGAFIMLEKVNFSNSIFQSIVNELYFDFKKDQKLTDSDILNKSKSLRGVLDPFDSNEHITTLKKIGFKKAEVVMKIDFFELILAIR